MGEDAWHEGLDGFEKAQDGSNAGLHGALVSAFPEAFRLFRALVAP